MSLMRLVKLCDLDLRRSHARLKPNDRIIAIRSFSVRMCLVFGLEAGTARQDRDGLSPSTAAASQQQAAGVAAGRSSAPTSVPQHVEPAAAAAEKVGLSASTV